MAQHRSEELEINKKLESLSKDELIQIIDKLQNQGIMNKTKDELMQIIHQFQNHQIIDKTIDELMQIIHQLQNQQVTDTTSSISNDNEEQPANILLHKRSKTAVNSYESTEIQMESPDNQSLADDDQQEKIKIGEF
ncbi:unnamed protein product [Rotaria sp. Silwood2]|nr:unnamed protein product [Rotaria sp. Silwood2]CAF3095903.1 unnamed protein product [Rotaria sp. Silwood2]CAF3380237.1 unnamed protein product [Rotaria sp. Silwood2]CAF3957041.1 unnamed protein product [Rotaria sp. Silwood2]CAF4339117.1 unnamed protein product [Rotaria sp. Silwood2]